MPEKSKYGSRKMEVSSDKTLILEEAADFAKERLKTSLPDTCRYHTLNHTMEVVRATGELINAVDLDPHYHELLLIAAWFHDLGYEIKHNNHEHVSMIIAKNFLERRDFPSDDSKLILDCIKATEFRFEPRTLPEKIICDADMYHLGSPDYFEKMRLLREEWKLARNKNFNEQEWLAQNIKFLSDHTYYTTYARMKWGPRKEKNLNILREAFRDRSNSA